MATPAVNLTTCHFRDVHCSQPVAACDQCQRPATRIDDVSRTAIDIALDAPALLRVTVSVHRCAPCRHTFRLQPSFLRKDALYTRRVVATAVASVYEDGMAFRRVPARLARDFWVQPSEAMIRQWCKAYGQALDFAGEYQSWVVREFSGVLCVDEVYQDQMALLLAVDSAAPDGDRLVGYQLVHGSVSQQDMADFLQHLKQVGIEPAQVVTDGSPLYPSTVAAVWPQAAHQLCLFHQTRHVTKAVREVIKAVRADLPALPAGFRAAADQRGSSTSDHAAAGTPLDPPAVAPLPRRGRGRCRRELRQAGMALVHALRRQGGSVQGIARQTGISRPTVRSWLQQPDPSGADDVADGTPVPVRRLDLLLPPDPPPAVPTRASHRGGPRRLRRALCQPGRVSAATGAHVSGGLVQHLAR